jgi:hypothetical protein
MSTSVPNDESPFGGRPAQRVYLITDTTGQTANGLRKIGGFLFIQVDADGEKNIFDDVVHVV